MTKLRTLYPEPLDDKGVGTDCVIAVAHSGGFSFVFMTDNEEDGITAFNNLDHAKIFTRTRAEYVVQRFLTGSPALILSIEEAILHVVMYQ